jgi:regulator of protease activity HflC (stomatin/prohibitin superfamily)
VEILIGVGIALILAMLLARAFVSVVTVYEYQRGLKYVRGRLVGVVEPGRYWLFAPTQVIWIVDGREALLPVPGQEVITSDGVSVKLSLAVRHRVTDPVPAYTKVEDYRGACYQLLQVALREIVAAMTIDEVLEQRETIGPSVLERCAEPARELGVELVAVQVKDLMFPGQLKRTFAQVIEARQQGLAALEKARGETAALRSLANAARMVDANPSLLQLRTIQQLESSSGNTVIVGLPASSTPVPVRPPADRPQLEGGQTEAESTES